MTAALNKQEERIKRIQKFKRCLALEIRNQLDATRCNVIVFSYLRFVVYEVALFGSLSVHLLMACSYYNRGLTIQGLLYNLGVKRHTTQGFLYFIILYLSIKHVQVTKSEACQVFC